MDELLELYQETVLEHSKSPRRSNRLPIVSSAISAKNPLCGDLVTLEVLIEDGVVKDIGCVTNGCAISTAAGSIMAEEIVGTNVKEAIELCDSFIAAVKDKEELLHDSDQLHLLCKVADYPMRIKCAILPWDALKKALQDKQ